MSAHPGIKSPISTINSEKSDATDFSLQTAQMTFRNLVDSLRASSLWFLKKDLPIDITSSNAPAILEYCAKNCSRSQWILARKLLKWRSRNIR